MKIEIDQAKITAYALGELKGAEAARIEELSKGNPDLRRRIDEIRALGKELAFELNNEPLILSKPKRNILRLPLKYPEISAVLLIATILIIPLRQKIRNYAERLDESPLMEDSQINAGDPNVGALRFLESLEERPSEEARVGNCAFQVPRLLRPDSMGAPLASALEGQSGLSRELSYSSPTGSAAFNLAVNLGAVAGRTFTPDPKDIITKLGELQFVSRHLSPESAMVFGFEASTNFYCWASVKLKGSLEGAALSAVSQKIDSLAAKIAHSLKTGQIQR